MKKCITNTGGCSNCTYCEARRISGLRTAKFSNPKKLQSELLSIINNNVLSDETIKLFAPVLDFDQLSRTQKLSYTTILENITEVNFNNVSKYQRINKEIIANAGHLIDPARIKYNDVTFNVIEFFIYLNESAGIEINLITDTCMMNMNTFIGYIQNDLLDVIYEHLIEYFVSLEEMKSSIDTLNEAMNAIYSHVVTSTIKKVL